MTRLDALTSLRDKVQAGDISGYPAKSLYTAVGSENLERFMRAVHGSLDAAKALHEAVLPGWEWHLGPSNAKVYPYNGSPAMSWSGMAETPARAWLLAILEALIAQEKEKT